MTTTTTDMVRDRALAPLASDIPADMTIGEYRRMRTGSSRRRRARAWLRVVHPQDAEG
jgi:hypothetical protein